MSALTPAGWPAEDARILALRRPHKNLLALYGLQSALTLVFFPFVLLPLACKYATLRYSFDQEGVNVC